MRTRPIDESSAAALTVIATNGAAVLIDQRDEEVLCATLANGMRIPLRVSIATNGYPSIGLGTFREYLHRLVARARPGEIIDHINGVRTDCRRANLRKVSRAQNLWNRGPARHNKSGYKGVSYCRDTGRWRAEIRVNKRRVHIGRFFHPEEAALAYDQAALKYHGEFAKLNFGDAPGQGGRGCE